MFQDSTTSFLNFLITFFLTTILFKNKKIPCKHLHGIYQALCGILALPRAPISIFSRILEFYFLDCNCYNNIASPIHYTGTFLTQTLECVEALHNADRRINIHSFSWTSLPFNHFWFVSQRN